MNSKNCKTCQKECEKTYCSSCKSKTYYHKERRENPNKFTNQYNRALVRKIYLIEFKGGKCEKCNYNKNLSALDFHHKDPKEKEFKLDSRKLANTSLEKIKSEVEKCLLLCATCHREIHHPDLEIEKVKEKLKQYSEFKKAKHLKLRQGKPKCIDCKKEINYNSTRCSPCNKIYNYSKNKPDKQELIQSIKLLGITKTATKYNVARRTVHKWLQE